MLTKSPDPCSLEALILYGEFGVYSHLELTSSFSGCSNTSRTPGSPGLGFSHWGVGNSKLSRFMALLEGAGDLVSWL